jgi:Domain of Unknown Function (DUF1259)
MIGRPLTLIIVALAAGLALTGCRDGKGEEASTSSDADRAQKAPTPGPIDAETIRRGLGAEVNATEYGTVRATWPRTDVEVTIDGIRFPPPAGLTSWVAFTPTTDGAMMMGDTVVFQDEVDAAMDAAFAHGLEVSALHNHFFYDQPKVYFMHVGGRGEAEALARGVKDMWDAIRAVRRVDPLPGNTFQGEAPSPGGELDAVAIGRVIGEPTSTAEGVVKVTLGRDASMHGSPFGKSMGLTTWAAFTGSGELAVMDGDFAMTAEEVQPVLRALRRANIHVVALHNHMIGETPGYYFTHFWAKGPVLDLARGFRSALDAQREIAREPH